MSDFDPNATMVQRAKKAVRRRVINNWRSRVSDFSTIALAAGASVIALWSTLPADWLKFLPTEWVAKGTGLISLLGLVGKFVRQPGKDGE
jgi:purine-cytosine permease-like protein